MAAQSPFRGFRGFNTPNNTQVPDEIFDELMVNLSGAELKVLLYVIRRTYGFKRESDNISLSQMLTGIIKRDGVRLDSGTGLGKPTLLAALRSLAEKGMIVPERRRSAERGDQATTYRLRLFTEGQLNGAEEPDSASAEGKETNTPVVKKVSQGGTKNLPTPEGKESAHAVVKKSAPQVTVGKDQDYKVVNDVTDHDPKTTLKDDRPATSRPTPTISDRALRSKYGLTDGQIGQVHWLVQEQLEILGRFNEKGQDNHPNYVKRAAEAVQIGDHQFLAHMLGDFKQAATTIAVGSRPAYFHAMYTEALQKHRAVADTPPLPQVSERSPTGEPQRLGESFGDIFQPAQDHTVDDPRARLIADAERRGFAVPEHIRTADIRAVNRWWAALAADPKRQA